MMSLVNDLQGCVYARNRHDKLEESGILLQRPNVSRLLDGVSIGGALVCAIHILPGGRRLVKELGRSLALHGWLL